MFSHVDCISCMVNKCNRISDQYINNKGRKYEFMRTALQKILDSDYKIPAPIIIAQIFEYFDSTMNLGDIYKEEKDHFNNIMMKYERQIQEKLDGVDDKFFEALKYATAGNIIDYGILDHVSVSMFNEAFESVRFDNFNSNLIDRLKKELAVCKNCLYIADNAGEIVLDKVLIREIKREFPKIKVQFMVRGNNIFNDVTREDAYLVGVNEYAEIVDNGSNLPGVDLESLSEDRLQYINNADIIISKGQGNFETLVGCGKNIYYIFLCKCEVMMNKLKMDKNAKMFANERDIVV